MSTAPAGSLSLSKANLKNSLANSATFQAFVGAANATEASARIHNSAWPIPADGVAHTLAECLDIRPCAVIAVNLDEGHSGYISTQETDGGFNRMGILTLLIYWTIPDEIKTDINEISTRMENLLGQIMRDIELQVNQADRLDFKTDYIGKIERSKVEDVFNEGDELVGEMVFVWEGI